MTANDHRTLRRGKEGFLPGVSGDSGALPVPRFWSSGLRNCTRRYLRWLKPPSLRHFGTAALGDKYAAARGFLEATAS